MVHFRQDDVLEASAGVRRLFIHGNDDQWAASEVIEARLAGYPRTAVHVIDGPHNLVVAQPKLTAQLITEHVGAR
jgi:pimeloyl-ACP methyl ester carboxylesterase